MFGLLTHEEPNTVTDIHRFLITARLVLFFIFFTILHGCKLRLHYKPLYCGEMQSMWSKLQLRCHCEHLIMLYVVAAIAVADHNLKEYAVGSLHFSSHEI